ncbi:hypothetical protein JTB14_002488 [Gonioctena quinquepunctata]|nr:hypothetical protein JTB14_002488 [Gonioctena quinquepunctata]KAG5899940.1 hypothetical protein JTB14_002488 [Gonioctena quinquepunctata]
MSINNRYIVSCNKMNGNSNIPLRRPLGRQVSTPTNSSKIPINDPQAHRWKQKYDEAEERRKLLLTEKEKALRTLSDVEKKYLNLQIKHEHLETELFEKNEEFTKLSTASKNLYKEYETLKNQYETETRAMSGMNCQLGRNPNMYDSIFSSIAFFAILAKISWYSYLERALKDATQWYKENKVLKRKTLLLLDKDADDEGVDAGDGESNSDTDIENLNRTIKQLSSEVAELQTEVDSLKQTEFQTSEENVRLSEVSNIYFIARTKNGNFSMQLHFLEIQLKKVL